MKECGLFFIRDKVKPFLKMVVRFGANPIVNVVFGFLFLGICGLYNHYFMNDQVDIPTFFLSVFVFVSVDILSYGLSKLIVKKIYSVGRSPTKNF